MRNKIIFSLIVMGVFFTLFATLVSADLYLNSKTGTIYFIENYIIYITFILQFSICITALNCHLSHAVIHNTTGVARASIGPGGNFSINIENSENKFMNGSEFSKVQFLENGERIVHTSDFFVNQETFDEAVRIINDNIMLSIDNNIANGNEIENN